MNGLYSDGFTAYSRCRSLGCDLHNNVENGIKSGVSSRELSDEVALAGEHMNMLRAKEAIQAMVPHRYDAVVRYKLHGMVLTSLKSLFYMGAMASITRSIYGKISSLYPKDDVNAILPQEVWHKCIDEECLPIFFLESVTSVALILNLSVLSKYKNFKKWISLNAHTGKRLHDLFQSLFEFLDESIKIISTKETFSIKRDLILKCSKEIRNIVSYDLPLTDLAITAFLKSFTNNMDRSTEGYLCSRLNDLKKISSITDEVYRASKESSWAMGVASLIYALCISMLCLNKCGVIADHFLSPELLLVLLSIDLSLTSFAFKKASGTKIDLGCPISPDKLKCLIDRIDYYTTESQALIVEKFIMEYITNRALFASTASEYRLSKIISTVIKIFGKSSETFKIMQIAISFLEFPKERVLIIRNPTKRHVNMCEFHTKRHTANTPASTMEFAPSEEIDHSYVYYDRLATPEEIC